MPFLKLISETLDQDIRNNDFHDICSVCSKVVNRIDSALPCFHCRHFIHPNCSELSEQEKQSHYSKQWLCEFCKDDTFPFNTVKDDHELLSESFNSNESCPCNDSLKYLTHFDCVDVISELNLNKLDLNHFHPNSDNDIDNNISLNCNFDY